MNITARHDLEARQQRVQRLLSVRLCRGLALIGAIAVGLLMVGVVLAMDSYQTFHAAAEQMNLGVSVSGSYTDTFAADDSRRVIREEYVTDTVGESVLEDPATYEYTATWASLVNYSAYSMPQEGGLITRVAVYVFQPGDTQFRLALYEDRDGIPHYLLAETEPLTATSAGWLWFNIEPQFVRAGERFWIAYQANNTNAKLGWKTAPPGYGYRYHGWDWGNFPQPPAYSWTGANDRSFYRIEYVITQYGLDALYTVPVTPTMDAYTLTVEGLSSGETFTVTADGLPVGSIPYSPTVQIFFSDDMESGDGDWTTDLFTRTITDSVHYNSPVHVWWVDEGIPVDATLTSTVVTLPTNVRDMRLRFWHYMNVESEWDGGWLEYRSNDGTWGPWTKVERAMFISGGYPLVGYLTGGWTGSIPGEEVAVQIPMSLAGQSVQWRWRFMCDPGGGLAGEPNGWWIDDVRVQGIVPTDVELIYVLPLPAAADGEIEVGFQDTITDSYQDFLEIDLIEITGLLYNRPPTVTVTTPNGGEYWSGTRTIKWSGSDANRDVITYNVYLSTDGGNTWSSSLYEVSFNETETQAAHLWDGFDTTVFTDSGDCLIRIQASDGDASASDQSDAAFTIDNIAPSVTLTAPNGGEVLQGGGSYTITWTASDANFGSQPITLRYSTNGGLTFPNVITTATENDGSYTWIVPALDNSSVRVRVVATDLASNSGQDDSNDNFTVDSTPPNGTVTITEGEQTTSSEIHLTLDAPDDTVEMYLSGDIVDAPNVRQWITYTTTTTVTLTEGEGNKMVTVRYRDLAGNEGDLASDQVFRAPEPLRVYLPIVVSAH